MTPSIISEIRKAATQQLDGELGEHHEISGALYYIGIKLKPDTPMSIVRKISQYIIKNELTMSHIRKQKDRIQTMINRGQRLDAEMMLKNLEPFWADHGYHQDYARLMLQLLER